MTLSPRNPWQRLGSVLDACGRGTIREGERILDGLRYDAAVTDQVYGLYEGLLKASAVENGREFGVGPLNTPADFMGHPNGRFLAPFRRLNASLRPPQPYPNGMALPELIGEQNSTRFLRKAAAVSAGKAIVPLGRVHVVITGDSTDDIAGLLDDLAAQRFDAKVDVTLFGEGFSGFSDRAKVVDGPLLSPQGQAQLSRIVDRSDAVVFLSGAVALDTLFLERAAQMLRISENVVQPLAALPHTDGLKNLYTTRYLEKQFSSAHPFREIEGLNMVVPTPVLRVAGLPNINFNGPYQASRELAFRMTNMGAYLAPLSVPKLEPDMTGQKDSQDAALYAQLCPNSWDRKTDGQFQVPKVSIYIPAYNAERYITRAINSVLEQDLQDLEVCIADDGSTDGTIAVLEKHFAQEPRVRWETGPNGGIGHASNRAIALSKGRYVGQLDSDDCLKPGAVRRLAEYLDAHPQVACCYGSCERIDADGNYLKDEYSWPVFSREKMMITSIAHHFRMFRRSAWERTTRFREDIMNAVDYDIFLKLAETGHFHHVEEILYQRRWHGENTSDKNEVYQTTNTYRVQREALIRQGLDRFWDVHVPDKENLRRVSYRRKGAPIVLFWPDYSRGNPYQNLLYGAARDRVEFCAGRIEEALQLLDQGHAEPEDVTFHLHWLNFLFVHAEDEADARLKTDTFLELLEAFKARGGRVVWTIHNIVSHESPYRHIEVELSERLTEIADHLHFHSAASVAEVEQVFAIPKNKLLIARHGHYIDTYPDFITRQDARRALNISVDDEVILFTGQVRPYKGVEDLIVAFRAVLKDRPKALLLVAGQMEFDPRVDVAATLSDTEKERIRFTERFVDENELQVFFRAADMAVYPYRHILTSGSLLLAIGYGVPSIIPEVGMTKEVLGGRDAGVLYPPDGGAAALKSAMSALLARKDAGTLQTMGENARALAKEQVWQDFAATLGIA